MSLAWAGIVCNGDASDSNHSNFTLRNYTVKTPSQTIKGKAST